MYTYNKDDNSYTFSSDDLDLDILINPDEKDENNEISNSDENDSSSSNQTPKKIEVINGGNDLDISPVSDYLEVEKPKNEKRENIVIPKNNG